MTDVMRTLQLKGKEYPLVFNLNVMEAIQEEYGTMDQWGKLTDGTDGEPNAKAVIFGFREMINEGLDIKAEESGEEYKPITLKQCGRIITEYGLVNATMELNQTVIESTKVDTTKNA